MVSPPWTETLTRKGRCALRRGVVGHGRIPTDWFSPMSNICGGAGRVWAAPICCCLGVATCCTCAAPTCSVEATCGGAGCALGGTWAAAGTNGNVPGVMVSCFFSTNWQSSSVGVQVLALRGLRILNHYWLSTCRHWHRWVNQVAGEGLEGYGRRHPQLGERQLVVRVPDPPCNRVREAVLQASDVLLDVVLLAGQLA